MDRIACTLRFAPVLRRFAARWKPAQSAGSYAFLHKPADCAGFRTQEPALSFGLAETPLLSGRMFHVKQQSDGAWMV